MGAALIDRFHNAVNELGLTDEQKPKVDEIFAKAKDDFAQQQPQWRDLPPEERVQHVREFTQKLVGDVKAVLNDEQKAKFDQRVAELQSQRGGAQGGGQGMGQGGQTRRMREAIDALNLSDDQKQKVDGIFKDMETKVADAQKESQGDREAMREKMRMIAQDTTAQLEQVLTPDQQQQFRESMRAARGSGNGDGQGRGRRGDAPSTQPSGSGSPATQPEKKTSDR
jgi:Spy/CpxP family protein refolding chaperone